MRHSLNKKNSRGQASQVATVFSLPQLGSVRLCEAYELQGLYTSTLTGELSAEVVTERLLNGITEPQKQSIVFLK